MHPHTHPEMLSHSTNGQIFRCACCHSFTFIYKNIFLGLKEHELSSLRDCLEQLSNNMFLYPHPHGNKATISFERSEGRFGFTLQEKEEIIDLINQALLTQDAREIVQ